MELRSGSSPTRGALLRRRLRLWSIVLLIAVAGWFLWVKFERFSPTAEVHRPVGYVGAEAQVHIDVQEIGTGLAAVAIVLEAGGKEYLLSSKSFPARDWRGSGVRSHTFRFQVPTREAQIPEGPATLVVRATDHSWLNYVVDRPPTVELPVIVDHTPPEVEVLSSQHYLQQGGSDLIVYRTSGDDEESGVVLGDETFPGFHGLFADPKIAVALVAHSWNVPSSVRPKAFARDRAGNRRETVIAVNTKERSFRERTLEVSRSFLEEKVPELLRRNALPEPENLVEGYLRINRELREQSNERIHTLCNDPGEEPMWSGVFLRQPGSATLSKFADRRTYVYEGKVIDHQTHLGVDLASLARSPVAAANDGRVVHADDLGIYGQTVLLDHGLGLFTLYGHLSSVSVKVGDRVARGDTIGRTGETGLAGGDHLHFSTLIHGVHVDPVEWWDPRWVEAHVTSRIEAFGGSLKSP